jgi:hypothetical protein
MCSSRISSAMLVREQPIELGKRRIRPTRAARQRGNEAAHRGVIVSVGPGAANHQRASNDYRRCRVVHCHPCGLRTMAARKTPAMKARSGGPGPITWSLRGTSCDVLPSSCESPWPRWHRCWGLGWLRRRRPPADNRPSAGPARSPAKLRPRSRRLWCGLHTTALALLPLVLGGHARAAENEPKVITLSCDGMLTPTYDALRPCALRRRCQPECWR